MKKIIFNSSLTICLLASSSLLVSWQALSQEPVLEEITVTARKRTENLQDVAMSVSALSEQEITANFATDIRELIYMSPNTVVDDTEQGPGGVASAYIRGIGVSEVEKKL